MAEEKESTTSQAANGFGHLPVTRQIGILVGLAGSIALGVAVVLWSMDPNYRPLYSDISSRDTSDIVDILQKSGIKYKIDHSAGTILVSAAEVHEARIKVSAEGLPHGKGAGFEMLDKEGGFGSSQFMEAARYRHALEGELARTISNFRNVKSARIHLAIPKQSAFIRHRQKPSASVFVDLYSGRELSHSKVAAIINLVSSSVSGLSNDNVTVVDDTGRLLSDGGGEDGFAAADRMLNYKHQIETTYSNKIQDLLSQVLGPGRVKARVTADIDFTQVEETNETFNPSTKAIRSEQTMDETRVVGGKSSGGIPGALSNKDGGAGGSDSEDGKKSAPVDSRTQATRNFEMDKKISHIQNHAGQIKRISVAVVVDDEQIVDSKTGKSVSKPLGKADIDKFVLLIKDAVGFDEKRGDSVNIINKAFAKPEAVEALPELTMTQQPWFWSTVKQVLGGLFLLILVFGVLRPILKSLAERAVKGGGAVGMLPGGAAGAGGGMMMPGQANMVPGAQMGPDGDIEFKLPALAQSYEDHMAVLQDLAGKDPKRVAQVLKSWVDA